ncbi:MAG TPA: hypothetical protein VKE74_26165 [Gemmataceae bacterium]|nr:hypothetical protein [Gemmataceae bacterium]
MTRAHKVLGFLLVALVGIYGCAKGPNPTPAAAATEAKSNPALEAKLHRAEEDVKTAVAARDGLRQKLAAAEDQQARLRQQLDQAMQATEAAAQEREALRVEVRTRTIERDEVKAQYEGFRKSIREALGQAEAGTAVPAAPSPRTAVSTQPAPGGQN